MQLAEEAVLGTILKENHLMLDASLKEEYFSGENKALFIAMKELQQKGRLIDLVTLLTHSNHAAFGGAGKLNKIQSLANVNKFDKYVEILVDKWREREKLNILELARLENWNLNQITTALNNLVSNNIEDRHNIKDLVVGVYEDPWKKKEKKRGIPTGLKKLDLVTGGWQNGNLIIAAARPSIGKSDFMLTSAIAAGISGAKPIIFSLEMTAEEELRDRVIANIGNINRSKMRDLFELSEKQKEMWSTVLGEVAKTDIEIFDNSKQTTNEMRMKIRKIANENPGRQLIVFVDYLTLIKPGENFKVLDHHAVSEISKDLKSIAKEFNCPVISLAQLNRGVEKRENKRPVLSDLRESGSIEEDANVVALLYRDSYYSGNEDDNSFEINVAKHRGGPIGLVRAVYNKFTGAISDGDGQ